MSDHTEPAQQADRPDPIVEQALTDGELEATPALRAKILDSVAAAPSVEPRFQLAQMNTARFRYPMDDPKMLGFVEMLDPVNHQADSAEGFVWRLTDEESNNATSITYYENDPLLLVNISVWDDVAALRNYVYRTSHVDMVKRRDEWADAMDEVYIVLWWVPAGHRPSVAEGDAKLRTLRDAGPTAEAFTFGRSFPPPE